MAIVIRGDKLPAAEMFSFADLETRGRDILQRAESRARQILQEAEAAAQRIAEQRNQEGYARGLEEGRRDGLAQIRAEARQAAFAEAQQRLAALTDALTAGLQQFDRDKRRLLAVAEAGLIELALAIATRVCKAAVGNSSDAARANARHLLDMARHEGDLELHVNPDEGEALREVANSFSQETAKLAHVQVVEDPAVQRGGCLLRTRTGTIDTSIETQLQRIAETILGNQPGEG